MTSNSLKKQKPTASQLLDQLHTGKGAADLRDATAGVASERGDRIRKVEWVRFGIENKHEYVYKYQLDRLKADGIKLPTSKHLSVALRIQTDDGREGYWKGGMSSGPLAGDDKSITVTQLEAASTPHILGHPASDVLGIWRKLYDANVPLMVLNAVDIALWDLLGRGQGKPVHRLLGTKRDKIKAYASSHPNLGTPEEYAQFALSLKKRGYHSHKIHPYVYFDPVTWRPIPMSRVEAGHYGPEDGGFVDHDLAVAATVREAVGSDFHLTWDNYHTYTYEQALRVGRKLQELNYGWLESPMPEREDHLNDYIRLTEELDIPVCAPESLPGTHLERVHWQRQQAMDINRTDLNYGGFTACYLLARDCEENDVKLELHVGGFRILHVAACFSDAVIEHFERHDTNPEESARWFTEIEKSHPGATTVATKGGHHKRKLLPPTLDGYQRVPEEPGLEIELDWDYIREHAVNS